MTFGFPKGWLHTFSSKCGRFSVSVLGKMKVSSAPFAIFALIRNNLKFHGLGNVKFNTNITDIDGYVKGLFNEGFLFHMKGNNFNLA